MDDLIHLIPEKWRGTALLLLAISPYATRAFQSLRNGGGLRGIMASIWLGTNVPKGTASPAELKTLRADVAAAITSNDTKFLTKETKA